MSFMHDPREPHLSALKRILRYVRGTLSYGLQLYSSTTSSLVAYSDADWAGYPTTRRSTSGYCVFLGNNLLSWSSKGQFTLSRSCAEAEYRVVANCGCLKTARLPTFSNITGDDVGKDNGVNSSPTMFTPGNLVVNKEDNLRGENDGLKNKGVNLLKEDVSNVPVWVKLHGVPVTAFSDYARALIEVRADVELKDNIVVAMPKLVREGFYTCNVHVVYEWKPSTCACCNVFGHVHDGCPKNIDSDVVKNMTKPSQTPRGVPIGHKVGFKPVKQAYIHVSNKNSANSSGNKKIDAEPTIEVSNTNPFDVLNSVENDVDLGTTGGTSNLASKKVNSSGSLFWNMESCSTNTTNIIEKNDKVERLIIKGKVTLVDDEGKPVSGRNNGSQRPKNQNPNGQKLPVDVRKLQSENHDDPTVQSLVIGKTLQLDLGDILL
ncbi:high affinity nitrate transporter 2.6-like protein [Tanacetum coccineum]